MKKAPPPDTVKLTDEKWLNLFARTFRHGKKTVRWLFASRKAKPNQSRTADAALIVPILIDDPAAPKLIATREFRVPIWDHEWGVPAGLVEDGEAVEEAARRELLEETGYELAEIQKISPLNYSSTGMTDEAVVMVFCTCRTPKDFRQRLDGAEQIEVHPLTLAEVDKLVDTKQPINGRAWMAFYMYHRLGRFLEPSAARPPRKQPAVRVKKLVKKQR